MTTPATAGATAANLAKAKRNAAGRRINPDTGKGFRKTKEQVEELEQAILDVVATERPLTLRRLHYALVSMGLQPNTLGDYRELSRRVVVMRRAGRIPKGTFVDNARITVYPYMWGSLDEALDALASGYRRDPWEWSDDRAMVMVEKDALRGVLEPTTNVLFVPLGIARGRASESFLEDMADTINREMQEYDGILHLGYIGDWDPTGWANPADIEKRLRGFLDEPDRLDFVRLGLDPAQITALGLPQAMVAKMADPNYRSWPGGAVAVEVDAVPVAELQSWVEDFVNQYIDSLAFANAMVAARADVEVIKSFRADT